MRATSVTLLALLPALLAPSQCGSIDKSASAPASQTVAPAPSSSGSPDSLRTIPEAYNPCALFPAFAPQRLFGPPDGPMKLVRSMSDTTWAGTGKVRPGTACMFRLAPRPGVPKGSAVLFEVIFDGALAFETGAQTMNRAAKNMLDLIGAKTADGARHDFDGWDYLGAYPREMTGRVGHVAFHVDWDGVAISLDTLEKAIATMRDELPDLPVAVADTSAGLESEDACSLVTREEVESVLGKLAAPPYESRDLSALAEKPGKGCSYYTKNHHVLTIRPWREHGRVVFPVSGLTEKVGTAIPTKYPGEFDRIGVNAIDVLYFLKGDQMLAVSWKMSSTDEAGAVKIASIAMKRLASQ